MSSASAARAPPARKAIRGGFPPAAPGGEWAKGETDGKNDREPDQAHGHLGGGGLPGSLAEGHDAHQHSAARAARRILSGAPAPGELDRSVVGDRIWMEQRRAGADHSCLLNPRPAWQESRTGTPPAPFLSAAHPRASGTY